LHNTIFGKNPASYAYPAEIENRTATCVSLLIDLPLVITMGTKSDTIGLGAGVGFCRDIAFCQTEFLQAMPERAALLQMMFQKSTVGFGAMHDGCIQKCLLHMCIFFPNGWRVGLETRFYLPLGSLISGHGMDGMMVSTALRLVLPE